jgi:hypothetical protein
MFFQIHTRVIIHETTGILPCARGGGGDLLRTWPITTRYRFFGKLERIPTHITLMNIVKRPLLTKERR